MSSEERHSNLTIGIGDISPDGNCKVLAIKNDGVTIGVGPQHHYSNMSEISFSDCELLWGL